MYSIFKLHYLPLFSSVWFLGLFSTSYLISVLDGHVYAFFPFISDTGALAPESCIYGQMTNLGSAILGIELYLRFLQFKQYIDYGYINIHQRWNKIAIICGGLACLGISITGNFQETNLLAVHLFGAGLIAAFGTLYFIIQTRIAHESVKLKERFPKHGISKSMFYCRLLIIITIIISNWILLLSGIFAYNEFTGSSIQWWTEEDGAFELRIVAAFSEWILFILMFVYISTFTCEFKLIKFEEVIINVEGISKGGQITSI